MLKKILLAVGALVVLAVALIVAIPFFVDANRFKPQIMAAVDQNLNADLDLGRLSLSLWGGVNIGVESLTLSEKGSAGKKPVFAMKDATFKLPYSSIFSGRPDVTLVVKSPQVRVVKRADGTLNVSKLSKSSGQADTPASGKGSSGGGGAVAVPFDLSFMIQDGYFVYADEKAKTQTEIKSFDFALKEFSINKPFEFSFKSNFDVKQVEGLVLRGPMTFAGQARIDLSSGGELNKVDFKSKSDFSGVLVKYGALINKDDKVSLVADVDMSASPKQIDLKQVGLSFGDARVDVTGQVQLPSGEAGSPALNLKIVSNDFNFQKWQGVLGPLSEYKMVGSSRFDIKIGGMASKPSFDGQANLNGFGMSLPGLAQNLSDMKAQLKFSNDTAVLKDTSLRFGKSDLSFDGSVKNFFAPVVRFNVTSQFFDMDSLLPKKPEAAKAQSASADENSDPGAALSGPIAAMKKNPVMRALDFLGTLKMKKVLVHNAEVTNLDSELVFKNLKMNLNKAKANAFGGSTNFITSIDFNGVQPAYTVGGDVAGLDVNGAVTSQMPIAKDTLFGTLFAKFNVQGLGITKPQVKSSLKGQGNFRIEKGKFSGLAAMKTLGEKLKSIPKLGEKLGSVQISESFKQLKSDFSIGDGKIKIVKMVADMDQANTMITGDGYVDFDMNLELVGKCITPGGGSDLPSELKSSDGRLSLPFEIAGKVNSPTLKAEKTLEVAGKAFLKKEGQAQLKKGLEKAVEKIDNPQVKELLKKLPF